MNEEREKETEGEAASERERKEEEGRERKREGMRERKKGKMKDGETILPPRYPRQPSRFRPARGEPLRENAGF